MTISNKKIIYAVILLSIISIAIYGVFEKRETDYVAQQKVATGLFTNTEDSDGDGLKDWEEILWKTDKNNPDTDGDGISDGDEVSLNKDPAVKGPADNLSDPVTDSKTAKLAEQFVDTYKKYIEEGRPIEEAGTELSEQLKTDNFEVSPQKTYLVTDINLIESNSENIHRYGNDLANSFSIFQKNITNNEFVIYLEAIAYSDEEKINELDPIIKNYKEFLSAILTMQTPTVFSEEHLSLVNNMNLLITKMEAMRLVFVDPLVASSGFFSLKDSVNETANDILDISRKIKQNNIEYTQEEAGYVFTNVL